MIPPTVAARLVVADHRTGWRAPHALAAAPPGAWLPSGGDGTYRLAAPAATGRGTTV